MKSSSVNGALQNTRTGQLKSELEEARHVSAAWRSLLERSAVIFAKISQQMVVPRSVESIIEMHAEASPALATLHDGESSVGANPPRA